MRPTSSGAFSRRRRILEKFGQRTGYGHELARGGSSKRRRLIRVGLSAAEFSLLGSPLLSPQSRLVSPALPVLTDGWGWLVGPLFYAQCGTSGGNLVKPRGADETTSYLLPLLPHPGRASRGHDVHTERCLRGGRDQALLRSVLGGSQRRRFLVTVVCRRALGCEVTYLNLLGCEEASVLLLRL